MADERVVHDLNADPTLPFADESFDDVVCCVSVDYLTRPVEVFADVARVLRPGGRFVTTFSNRCFPTKAIRGWLANDDAGPLPHRHRLLRGQRPVRAGDRRRPGPTRPRRRPALRRVAAAALRRELVTPGVTNSRISTGRTAN